MLRTVRRLTRYQLTHLALSLPVAVLLLAGLIWILQVMRLGHHLMVTADSDSVRLLGRLLLFSLPTLLSVALPLGLAAAVLHTLGQLAETGELEAMRTLGLSPLQLAIPSALITVVAACVALTAAHLEPPAMRALDRTVASAAVRSLVHGLRPGQFHQLPDDTVLFVQGRGSAAGERVQNQG